MLLVNFTTAVGVNASTDIQRSLTGTYLTNPQLDKDESHLSHDHVISVRYDDTCNLKQVTSSNGIMSSYVMAA